MGTGSSRARKTLSCRGSPPRPGSGPRWGSRSSSAPAGQEEEAAAPAAQPSAPDSDLELLDQVLAECDDEGLFSPLPPGSRPLASSAGESRSRPAGVNDAEGGGRGDQQVLLTRSTPESKNFANQLPIKTPEQQDNIAYNYSEEELMAAIEQEYCS